MPCTVFFLINALVRLQAQIWLHGCIALISSFPTMVLNWKYDNLKFHTKKQHSTLLSHFESSIFSLYLPSTPINKITVKPKTLWTKFHANISSYHNTEDPMLIWPTVTEIFAWNLVHRVFGFTVVETLEEMHDSKWDKRVESCFLV